MEIKKEKVMCSEHCVCFQGVCEKKVFHEFEKKLYASSGKLNKKLKPQGLNITTQTFIGIRKKKGIFRYGISINAFKGVGESVAKYCKVFPALNRINNLSQMLAWEPDKGIGCTELVFNQKEFGLTGELVLPATLPASSALIGKLGKPSLDGFKIEFAKSPVGLERVDIYTIEEYRILEIRVTHSFKPSGEKDIFRVTFNKSLELSKLFLVKK